MVVSTTMVPPAQRRPHGRDDLLDDSRIGQAQDEAPHTPRHVGRRSRDRPAPRPQCLATAGVEVVADHGETGIQEPLRQAPSRPVPARSAPPGSCSWRASDGREPVNQLSIVQDRTSRKNAPIRAATATQPARKPSTEVVRRPGDLEAEGRHEHRAIGGSDARRQRARLVDDLARHDRRAGQGIEAVETGAIDGPRQQADDDPRERPGREVEGDLPGLVDLDAPDDAGRPAARVRRTPRSATAGRRTAGWRATRRPGAATADAQAPAAFAGRQRRPSQKAIPIIGATLNQILRPETTSGSQ